jgi:hypothetical protein
VRIAEHNTRADSSARSGSLNPFPRPLRAVSDALSRSQFLSPPLPVLVRAAPMGALLSQPVPPQPLLLRGRATKMSRSGVRVCLSLAPAASVARAGEVCAVSTRAHRRAACGDACRTACAALPDLPGARRARAVCRRVCCDVVAGLGCAFVVGCRVLTLCVALYIACCCGLC